jgi:hypothetical protein
MPHPVCLFLSTTKRSGVTKITLDRYSDNYMPFMMSLQAHCMAEKPILVGSSVDLIAPFGDLGMEKRAVVQQSVDWSR